MPGLINKENRSALPLSVSDITSCVRGYTLAMTASMTYENIEDHAIEGEYAIGDYFTLFSYPKQCMTHPLFQNSLQKPLLNILLALY